jgi:hypothetical protein
MSARASVVNLNPVGSSGPSFPEVPSRPIDAPPLPTKPATPFFTKLSECDLCGKTRFPITDDELLMSAIMPMTYRCFNCGYMSKRFEGIETHRKQSDHPKIGMAHSDLGEVRCGYCKSILEKDSHSHTQ